MLSRLLAQRLIQVNWARKRQRSSVRSTYWGGGANDPCFKFDNDT